MASASSDPSASSSSDLLRNARFSAGPSAPEISAPSSAQLLHDAAALHPMANLGRADLDYLLLDDAKLNDIRGGSTVLPTRSWGDELCYGTGTTYLFGLGAGGLWGLREGWARSRRIPMTSSITLDSTLKQASSAATAAVNSSLKSGTVGVSPATVTGATAATATAPSAASRASSTLRSPSFRVRLNTVLNSITRRGSFVGNNAGVLALIYNATNSSIDKYRGLHDIYGSMLAGATTGLLWKSTAGIRPMAIASAGMTLGAAAWTTIKPKLV
ncbi:Mitochondrial import inner membrane translocase subunit tim23 [Cystobasidiomycetes sp. EMM_F5]